MNGVPKMEPSRHDSGVAVSQSVTHVFPSESDSPVSGHAHTSWQGTIQGYWQGSPTLHAQSLNLYIPELLELWNYPK